MCRGRILLALRAKFAPAEGNCFARASPLRGSHATHHAFRRTALQAARRGEGRSARVARNVHLSSSVMLDHYADETDEELRQASSRTYYRLLAGFPPEIAKRYICGDEKERTDDLESRLRTAVAAKDGKLAQPIASLCLIGTISVQADAAHKLRRRPMGWGTGQRRSRIIVKHASDRQTRSGGAMQASVPQGITSTPGRIRTCNQRIRNPLLYPLSYGRKCLWRQTLTMPA